MKSLRKYNLNFCHLYLIQWLYLNHRLIIISMSSCYPFQCLRGKSDSWSQIKGLRSSGSWPVSTKCQLSIKEGGESDGCPLIAVPKSTQLIHFITSAWKGHQDDFRSHLWLDSGLSVRSWLTVTRKTPQSLLRAWHVSCLFLPQLPVISASASLKGLQRSWWNHLRSQNRNCIKFSVSEYFLSNINFKCEFWSPRTLGVKNVKNIFKGVKDIYYCAHEIANSSRDQESKKEKWGLSEMSGINRA